MSIQKISIPALIILLVSCNPPEPKKVPLPVKHNYIILLDLSDRLIVQPDQPARDKEIIKSIYDIYERKIKKDLYIRSRDELKVVIAPQRGSGLQTEIFEERLYVNIENIQKVYRRPKEEERRNKFTSTLDQLYKKAVFSDIPEEYYGADIWKYFYEDLRDDYSNDTLTKNFLFILTDGYPIVGKDLSKLQPIKDTFPELHIVLLEIAPRDKDLEWDHIMENWKKWFDSMQIREYTFIKRKAISKEIEQIKELTGV